MAPKQQKTTKISKVNNDNTGITENTNTGTESSAYKKRSLYEHVLKEPDMFMGSVIPAPEQMWVYDQKTDKFSFKNIVFPPDRKSVV